MVKLRVERIKIDCGLKKIDMLKAYIGTNGCIEGQLSSKHLERFLINNGMSITKDSAVADIVIFYACGLTQQKERDSLDIIKKFKTKIKSDAKLLVWGCLPKINPRSLKGIYDGPLIGTLDVNFFAEIPKNVAFPLDKISHACDSNELCTMDTSTIYSYNLDPLTTSILLFKQGLDRFSDRLHKNDKIYFIPIGTGCRGKCTYCGERPVFGRPKSRPIESILSEFEKGLQQGYKRFSLIATDSGSYGIDIGYTLPYLLRKIIQTNDKKDFKIIINQLEFLHFAEICADMEDILSSGKIEKFECPVQSGSNRILELMNRGYKAEEWRTHMIQINQKYPKIRLATHFMVGFPTETDEDFNETLRLLDPPLFLDSMYIFRYSNRPKEYASHMSGQISEKTKELRYKKLQQKYAKMYVRHFMKLR